MMGTELDAWVRRAGDGDAELIARHRDLSRREGTRYRGGSMDLRLSSVEGVALVAGFGGTPMGSLCAVRDRDHGWVIEVVYVEEAAREVGLGDALLSEFLRIAANSGVDRVMAQALPGDRSMKNLFERHGLVARTILVGADLSARSSGADASR